LLLAVRFEKHDRYDHDGANLRLVVPLTLLEAIQGAKVKVPTPDGAIRVSPPEESERAVQLATELEALYEPHPRSDWD
jgi:DnaJ-class molecular chaperone